MNQRIQVRLIVKREGKVLLLKRSTGREYLIGKYELPGGRVEQGEQPEEALVRHLKETTGLTAQSFYLSDALTYMDSEGRDIQYAVIVYTVGLFGSKSDIELGPNYSRYAWEKPADVHEQELTELSLLLLAAHDEKPVMADAAAREDTIEAGAKKQEGIVIYSDGGSRGNPGPSAAGYVIIGGDTKLLYEGGAYLGITTNNQAEYHGVLLGLEKAKEMGVKVIEFRLDSLLVVNQLNGLYVIRNRELWPVHERIRGLIAQFDKVTFRHVKREFNQQADGMVNKILDARGDKKV